MPKEPALLDFMAKACHYAQEHVGDPDAWTENSIAREEYLQCVSYQMAAFLAQNTVEGLRGVDYDVLLSELCDNTKNKDGTMVKAVATWKRIIAKKAKEYGGWGAWCYV